MGTFSILQGDVRDWLPLFPDSHFDACFCDPPYLLEFMGKEFDRQHKKMKGEFGNDGQRMQAWHETWAREVLRVVKPGAYMLAFGGTRTSHRLASAMEDVGFEIKDTLCWLTGQGFPKGGDIGEKLHRQAQQKAQHDLRFVRGTHLSAPVYACKKCGQVLLKIMQEQGSHTEGEGDGREKLHERREESSVERWSNLETTERELYRCEVCSMSHGILADGAEGRIHCRTSAGDGNKDRETPIQNRSCPPHGPQSEQQQTRELDAVLLERRAQAFRGYGTQLKPAQEPIVLARKLGAKGCLAIDECRVAGVPGNPGNKGDQKPGDFRDAGGYRGNDPSTYKERVIDKGLGRWPANLILSHHEACNDECHPDCPVRMLDEQTINKIHSAGSSRSGSKNPRTAKSGLINFLQGSERSTGNMHRFGDSGGASRFFYCAKVSPRERNLGRIDCRHPTLKPISLTTYLSRLLLPPPPSDPDLSPRRLLIPFSGAGSEIAGALLAGWDEVTGIEQDPESVEWSEARIPAALAERRT